MCGLVNVSILLIYIDIVGFGWCCVINKGIVGESDSTAVRVGGINTCIITMLRH